MLRCDWAHVCLLCPVCLLILNYINDTWFLGTVVCFVAPPFSVSIARFVQSALRFSNLLTKRKHARLLQSFIWKAPSECAQCPCVWTMQRLHCSEENDLWWVYELVSLTLAIHDTPDTSVAVTEVLPRFYEFFCCSPPFSFSIYGTAAVKSWIQFAECLWKFNSL